MPTPIDEPLDDLLRDFMRGNADAIDPQQLNDLARELVAHPDGVTSNRTVARALGTLWMVCLEEHKPGGATRALAVAELRRRGIL